MKVLFVVPSFSLVGGVSTHYLGLRDYWNIPYRYVYYGKRKYFPAIICLLPDLIIYIYQLLIYKPSIVVVNPSFRRIQVYRDGVYLLIAKLLRCQVVTFFHGWDFEYSGKVLESPSVIKFIYNKSSITYVLSSEFRNILLKIGITCPIQLTTTKVTDNLLDNFDIKQREGEINNILYLARADKKKGLIETIKAFEILKTSYPHLKLFVCGIGPALDQAINYSKGRNIQDVSFEGLVQGENLVQQFKRGDVYILPSYEEGMPTSVLEAMAFGLPIITRPVGGMIDFFEEEKMGYLIASLDPNEYAKCIEALINNPELTKKMSWYNHQYASTHFLSSRVVQVMELEFYKLIAEK